MVSGWWWCWCKLTLVFNFCTLVKLNNTYLHSRNDNNVNDTVLSVGIKVVQLYTEANILYFTLIDRAIYNKLVMWQFFKLWILPWLININNACFPFLRLSTHHLKISKRNTRSTRFIFNFISYVGNYEPTCIVTIKMVTM